MSTIMSYQAAPSWTAARPEDAEDAEAIRVTRRCYSIDGYSPVRVTIRVTEHQATVRTDSMPNGMTAWWREPTAEQRRMLVDEVLRGLGMRRVGRVQTLTANQRFHVYPIKKA